MTPFSQPNIKDHIMDWPFDDPKRGTLERGAYGCIVVDFPSNFKSNSIAKPGRNARRHYDTMSLKEVEALPVKDLAAENCVLFFWITGPFLAIGAHIPIMKAWGFDPTAMGFVWIKLNKNSPEMFFMKKDIFFGGGFTTRKNAEFCLIGKRGKSMRQDKGVPEVILSPRREHSRKPEEFRDRIDRYVGPDCRIAELFSRHNRPNWDAWGDQVGLFDEAA